MKNEKELTEAQKNTIYDYMSAKKLIKTTFQFGAEKTFNEMFGE